MPDENVSSAELIRSHRKDEIKRLKSQYNAVLDALIKAEDDRDRFFSMKQTMAGVYADERSNRQKMEAALKAVSTISGNTTPEKNDKQAYENAMDAIFQHCRNIFDPIEDE